MSKHLIFVVFLTIVSPVAFARTWYVLNSVNTCVPLTSKSVGGRFSNPYQERHWLRQQPGYRGRATTSESISQFGRTVDIVFRSKKGYKSSTNFTTLLFFSRLYGCLHQYSYLNPKAG